MLFIFYFSLLRLVYMVRIFLFMTVMWKMDCVGVNETIHMVRFHVCAMHWCVRCCTQLGSTPILCNCDVWFNVQFKTFSMSWYNKKMQSQTERITPCEQNHSIASNIPFPDITNRSLTSHHVNEPLHLGRSVEFWFLVAKTLPLYTKIYQQKMSPHGGLSLNAHSSQLVWYYVLCFITKFNIVPMEGMTSGDLIRIWYTLTCGLN